MVVTDERSSRSVGTSHYHALYQFRLMASYVTMQGNM